MEAHDGAFIVRDSNSQVGGGCRAVRAVPAGCLLCPRPSSWCGRSVVWDAASRCSSARLWQPGNFALTLKAAGAMHHYVIKAVPGGFQFGGFDETINHVYPTLGELITWHAT